MYCKISYFIRCYLHEEYNSEETGYTIANIDNSMKILFDAGPSFLKNFFGVPDSKVEIFMAVPCILDSAATGDTSSLDMSAYFEKEMKICNLIPIVSNYFSSDEFFFCYLPNEERRHYGVDNLYGFSLAIINKNDPALLAPTPVEEAESNPEQPPNAIVALEWICGNKPKRYNSTEYINACNLLAGYINGNPGKVARYYFGEVKKKAIQNDNLSCGTTGVGVPYIGMLLNKLDDFIKVCSRSDNIYPGNEVALKAELTKALIEIRRKTKSNNIPFSDKRIFNIIHDNTSCDFLKKLIKILVDYKRTGDYQQAYTVLKAILRDGSNDNLFTYCSGDLLSQFIAILLGLSSIYQVAGAGSKCVLQRGITFNNNPFLPKIDELHRKVKFIKTFCENITSKISKLKLFLQRNTNIIVVRNELKEFVDSVDLNITNGEIYYALNITDKNFDLNNNLNPNPENVNPLVAFKKFLVKPDNGYTVDQSLLISQQTSSVFNSERINKADLDGKVKGYLQKLKDQSRNFYIYVNLMCGLIKLNILIKKFSMIDFNVMERVQAFMGNCQETYDLENIKGRVNSFVSNGNNYETINELLKQNTPLTEAQTQILNGISAGELSIEETINIINDIITIRNLLDEKIVAVSTFEEQNKWLELYDFINTNFHLYFSDLNDNSPPLITGTMNNINDGSFSNTDFLLNLNINITKKNNTWAINGFRFGTHVDSTDVDYTNALYKIYSSHTISNRNKQAGIQSANQAKNDFVSKYNKFISNLNIAILNGEGGFDDSSLRVSNFDDFNLNFMGSVAGVAGEPTNGLLKIINEQLTIGNLEFVNIIGYLVPEMQEQEATIGGSIISQYGGDPPTGSNIVALWRTINDQVENLLLNLYNRCLNYMNNVQNNKETKTTLSDNSFTFNHNSKITNLNTPENIKKFMYIISYLYETDDFCKSLLFNSGDDDENAYTLDDPDIGLMDGLLLITQQYTYEDLGFCRGIYADLIDKNITINFLLHSQNPMFKLDSIKVMLYILAWSNRDTIVLVDSYFDPNCLEEQPQGGSSGPSQPQFNFYDNNPRYPPYSQYPQGYLGPQTVTQYINTIVPGMPGFGSFLDTIKYTVAIESGSDAASSYNETIPQFIPFVPLSDSSAPPPATSLATSSAIGSATSSATSSVVELDLTNVQENTFSNVRSIFAIIFFSMMNTFMFNNQSITNFLYDGTPIIPQPVPQIQDSQPIAFNTSFARFFLDSYFTNGNSTNNIRTLFNTYNKSTTIYDILQKVNKDIIIFAIKRMSEIFSYPSFSYNDVRLNSNKFYGRQLEGSVNPVYGDPIYLCIKLNEIISQMRGGKNNNKKKTIKKRKTRLIKNTRKTGRKQKISRKIKNKNNFKRSRK